MTGFGQAAGENERFRMTVTIRGVNHRFLDLSLRLTDDQRPLEPALRELLGSRLYRGRVEVALDIVPLGAREVEVAIDEEVAAALKTTCDALRARGLVAGELEIGHLLALPDVVKLAVRDPEWTAADRETLLAVTGEALAQLLAARAAEGEKLEAALLERLDGLERITGELAERREAVAEELAAALRQRISELLSGETLDEDRMAQEVAYLVDRSDVGEELDRLQSHLEHFRTVMAQDGSVGKRLDFLTQEVLRELNTLGAKCRDSEMTRGVLDAKALCEQLREQVQNIE